MSTREKLLSEIDRFLRRSKMPATTFGRAVINDTALVGRLRAGGSVRLETADKIREFIAANRPVRRKSCRPRSSAAA